ncbi:uncharacterized protein M421DRAFT_110822 [Didymella exigua CBS 183.55]|uniref:Uncharacterized protein n=1 Tax=Didymella exigua CBS 183.55 TaxID=1150837 RepID=A0A6A5S6A4_9PLEO|nr:uncharacterized protein M421DRAFT_110822 [Didymella exigua CBS 183.55]KAF1934026.1 hypothetical protein M421DRAFT_110822 [Didymella exigua CBS 183.55]
MLFGFSTLAAILTVGIVLAAPALDQWNEEPQLEDIQCRCLTFRANEQPTTCNFFESEGFGWRSAQILASQYDIKVQFASKRTISKVLAIPAPLPSDVLRTTSTGDAQSASRDESVSQNKIVCGFEREVRHMTHRHQIEPHTHFIGQVIAWLVLMMVLYAAGEYLWTRYTSRRPIKLTGEEKPLQASSSSVLSEKETPSDFS